MTDEVPECHAKTRKEWRTWLEKHHQSEKKVHLICHKKHTGVPSMSHRESMEDAICFGWIDTTLKRLDENTYRRTFAKRNKNSKWSSATQSYAKRLIKEKLMTPAGLKAYKEGLKKPVIDHGLPKNPDIPKDLEDKLAKDDLTFFNSLSPSNKRLFIYWIEKAKRPETRAKRISACVQHIKNRKKSYM